MAGTLLLRLLKVPLSVALERMLSYILIGPRWVWRVRENVVADGIVFQGSIHEMVAVENGNPRDWRRRYGR